MSGWAAWERLAGRAHDHAVRYDRFDRESWVEARKEVPSLQEMFLEFTLDQDYAAAFLQDFFLLLLKGDPRIRPAVEMAAKYIPNRAMIEKFSRYPELLNLRDRTANHLYASILAMLSMRTELEAAFKAMAKARQQAEQLQERIETARRLADKYRDLLESIDPTDVETLLFDTTDLDTGDDGDGGIGGSATLAEIEAALDALLGSLGQLQGELEEFADEAAGGVMLLLRSAANGAHRHLESQISLSDSFGLSPGVLLRMSYAERAALMERLSRNRIAKFADLIGAMRSCADAAVRQRMAGVPSEIVGVELGDDLTRLTSTEMMSLATPELATDFYLRYLERRLQVWQVRGPEPAGRGPMVLVCDESGTMTTRDIGDVTREAWSKALCLALVQIAHTQHRPVVYVGFAGPGFLHVVNMTEGRFEPVLEMTEHFFCGGTYYEDALDVAADLCVNHFVDTGHGRGDIVFISDDAYTLVTPDWLDGFRDRRRRAGIGCHGVLIGAGHSGTMDEVCDAVRPITGVIGGGEVTAGAGVFPSVL